MPKVKPENAQKYRELAKLYMAAVVYHMTSDELEFYVKTGKLPLKVKEII